MKYIITRQGLKSPRSKKLSTIDIASFDTLQEAVDSCKNSGFVFVGKTYFGDFLEYQKDGSRWTILAEMTWNDGKKTLASYKSDNITK